MAQRKFTKIDSNTKSGRVAVLARDKETDEWQQVESALNVEEAEKLADSLEDDDTERHTYVYDMADEDWGDDAPNNG